MKKSLLTKLVISVILLYSDGLHFNITVRKERIKVNKST